MMRVPYVRILPPLDHEATAHAAEQVALAQIPLSPPALSAVQAALAAWDEVRETIETERTAAAQQDAVARLFKDAAMPLRTLIRNHYPVFEHPRVVEFNRWLREQGMPQLQPNDTTPVQRKDP